MLVLCIHVCVTAQSNALRTQNCRTDAARKRGADIERQKDRIARTSVL